MRGHVQRSLAYFLVSDGDNILGVNQNTGMVSVISGAAIPDGANPLVAARGIALDRPRSRIIVVDSGRPALIAVSSSTGARSIISDGRMPNGRNPLVDPEGIVIDQDKAIAFVADEQRVRAIDLITGERVQL